jgi:hypothetical protein
VARAEVAQRHQQGRAMAEHLRLRGAVIDGQGLQRSEEVAEEPGQQRVLPLRLLL